MHLVAIAWLFVTVTMALAEAMSPQGSVLGAVVSFVGWGLVPLAIVGYIAAEPARRRARRERLARERAATDHGGSARDAGDRGGHAAAARAVAPEREEP